MERLKRRPFCGGEATVMEAMGEAWVKCCECHSSNGVSTGERARAIAAWNERPESDAIEGALRSALMTMSLARGILEKDGDEHGVAWNLRNEISQGTAALNAKSQATDAALSRQVACTDWLGLVPGKD